MNKDNHFKHGLLGATITCCLLFSLNTAGQETDSTRCEQQKKTHHTLKSRLYQVRDYLDSAAVRKVDPLYVEVPKNPWRVILHTKVKATDVDYMNTVHEPGPNNYSDWDICFRPPVGTSIGVWVGYRGLGVSYSQSLTQNSGRYFSLSTTAAKYGLTFRLRKFQISKINLSYTYYENGEIADEDENEYETYAPVWIRSIYLNGYYVFNGRRYSQAAAYSQSDIQRRSAGSFLVGATWYQSSLNFSDIMNAGIMLLSYNVGRIKSEQANIGFGYGYNLVPCRGLVINAMAMPNISVYNRVSTYTYDFNYCLPFDDEVADDYGEWNRETRTWANGQTHKPVPLDNPDTPTWQDDIDMWDVGSESKHTWLRFNVDVRVGMAYNWKNYFVGLQAQFNNYSYSKGECKVRLFDWYARAALGVRL